MFVRGIFTTSWVPILSEESRCCWSGTVHLHNASIDFEILLAADIHANIGIGCPGWIGIELSMKVPAIT